MKKHSLNFYIVISALFLCLLSSKPARCQGWPDHEIKTLPDSSFAVIETGKNGSIIRHCPFRDAKGNINEEQLIYVLGTFGKETWADPNNKEIARKYLEKYYNRFMKDIRKKGLQEPVNINKAKLTELVPLPRIGPVLAVKIAQYRKKHGSFKTVEDIQKIAGIGYETFNGIRYYIRTR